MVPKIVILHEYGAPRHFIALDYLQKAGFIGEIQSLEFNLLIQIARGMRHFSGKKNSKTFYNIKEISKLFLKKDQFVIIGAAPYDPIIPLLQRLKTRNKVIYYTSWPFWNGDRYVKKPLFLKQKDVWADFLKDLVSVGVTEAACRGVESLGSHAFHIPHAVDTQIFKPTSTKSEKSIILFVGSLIPRKGIPMLLDMIRANKWPDKTEFWFVGTGPFKSQILTMTKRYPVRYMGYISNDQKLASIYQQANLLVLPSLDGTDIENFGIVLIEAMACGLPVVTTDCVGPKEIVRDSTDGYVISQGNKEQLREEIVQLLENPRLRMAMGLNGRKKAEEIYSVQKIASRWENVIEVVQKNS